MSSTSVVETISVVDVDTHLVEPPDLWTSRVAARAADSVPHVRWDDEGHAEFWFLGNQRLGAVGAAAQAGWREPAPDHPRRWAEVDAAAWDAGARLRRMDEDGISAQVLYPNVSLHAAALMDIAEPALRHDCVAAYNDYQTEWSDAAPDRLLPVTSLPFWNLPATLAEIDRCAAAGHRGINFSQDPSVFGLPRLTDPHWDPLWAKADETGLPVNFHIATGDVSVVEKPGHASCGAHANYASMGVTLFLGNARTIAQLVCGGICHRYPGVQFVLVESGIGWLPFALDALDWQWRNCGVAAEHPEYDLLPSEYFQRQIHGSLWFERDNLAFVLERLGPGNLLYETDFPHPTSMSPGPASIAVSPRDFIDDTFGDLPAGVTRRILHDNAAALYGL